MRNQFLCTVAENRALCREHYRLVLRVPAFPATSPGQFVQIACRDPVEVEEEIEIDWEPGWRVERVGVELREPVAVLRRPFSLAGRRDVGGGVELEIIHRVVGVGTTWLSRLCAGHRVDVLGPLGNRFELPRQGQTALLVGGGVGIPPMLYLAGEMGGRAVALVGAVTQDLLPLTIVESSPDPCGASFCVEEFARNGIASIVSTDDASFGFAGFVTQALETYLDNAKPRAADVVIYTCGPELMMKRVVAIAGERGIECQVAVERAMACGMGTCQSCCIRVRKPDPAKPPLVGSDWCYRLACTDGPIFAGSELLW